MDWSALASIGGSIIGGLTGRSSARRQERAQAQANAQNLQIAEMNNQTIERNNAAQIKAHYDTLGQQQSNTDRAFGYNRKQADRAFRYNRRQDRIQLGRARRQDQFQRNMAYRGIRARVKDAKAAGLHPLYALGASTPQVGPGQYIPGDIVPGQASSGNVSGTGLALGSPVTPQVNPVFAPTGIATALSGLGESLARMSADQAMTKYYESLAARTMQEVNSGPRDAVTYPLPNSDAWINARSAPTQLVPLTPRTAAARASGMASTIGKFPYKPKKQGSDFISDHDNRGKAIRTPGVLQHSNAAIDRTKDWRYLGDEVGQIYNEVDRRVHQIKMLIRAMFVRPARSNRYTKKGAAGHSWKMFRSKGK